MSAVITEDTLEQLLADPRLVELCELQRTGDEVLDVIGLSENQHSDILAWLLDAREGHGQGDEILRDLLTSASTVARGSQGALDGRSATARFFADWPPSRIRTTSFGAAFTARELGLKAKERADLFVVDAQNKFILLIENKAGSRHSEEQLDLYRASASSALKANPRLSDYDQAYIALDWYLDSEDASSRPSGSYWLHLGYDWLKTSARRALMHVERGNAAARLVLSYCNRQTDWENPSEDRGALLASELHQVFPNAVKALIGESRGRVEREWLTSRDHDRSHLLFQLQNKGAIDLLKTTKGMASIGTALLDKIKVLPKDNVQPKRSSLFVCPRGYEQLGQDNLWPVYIHVRYSDSSQSKFTVALCWSAKAAQTAGGADELRHHLATLEPKFGKHSDSQWRRVILERGLDSPALLKRVVELEGRLFASLAVRANRQH